MDKVKHSDIAVHSVVPRGAKEMVYFELPNGKFVEWQRGAQTLNVKDEPRFEAQDQECFSLDYTKRDPTVTDVKRAIVAWLNED
jgi:hypothetical protein